MERAHLSMTLKYLQATGNPWPEQREQKTALGSGEKQRLKQLRCPLFKRLFFLQLCQTILAI